MAAYERFCMVHVVICTVIQQGERCADPGTKLAVVMVVSRFALIAKLATKKSVGLCLKNESLNTSRRSCVSFQEHLHVYNEDTSSEDKRNSISKTSIH